MKKRYIVVPAAMALLLGICASCAANELPSGFDRDQVIETSEGFIDQLNAQDYESCYDQFSDLMKESMSQKKLENTFTSIFEGLGGFVRFKSVSLSSSKSLGVEYAVCIVKCQYENEAATFTISLDKDMKVGGLYIK